MFHRHHCFCFPFFFLIRCCGFFFVFSAFFLICTFFFLSRCATHCGRIEGILSVAAIFIAEFMLIYFAKKSVPIHALALAIAIAIHLTHTLDASYASLYSSLIDSDETHIQMKLFNVSLWTCSAQEYPFFLFFFKISSGVWAQKNAVVLGNVQSVTVEFIF